MNTFSRSPSFSLVRRIGITLAVAVVPAMHALAAPAAMSDKASIDARYQADRSACMSRVDPDSRQACLREAGAARQESLRGTLGNGASADEAQWQQNALSRCTVHTDPVDRSACERMVLGKGESAGSVEGGGVIRQITTTLPPVQVAPGTPAR